VLILSWDFLSFGEIIGGTDEAGATFLDFVLLKNFEVEDRADFEAGFAGVDERMTSTKSP